MIYKSKNKILINRNMSNTYINKEINSIVK